MNNVMETSASCGQLHSSHPITWILCSKVFSFWLPERHKSVPCCGTGDFHHTLLVNIWRLNVSYNSYNSSMIWADHVHVVGTGPMDQLNICWNCEQFWSGCQLWLSSPVCQAWFQKPFTVFWHNCWNFWRPKMPKIGGMRHCHAIIHVMLRAEIDSPEGGSLVSIPWESSAQTPNEPKSLQGRELYWDLPMRPKELSGGWHTAIHPPALTGKLYPRLIQKRKNQGRDAKPMEPPRGAHLSVDQQQWQTLGGVWLTKGWAVT